VAILHGEGGVGKTRTAAEFCEQARDRGAIVLWGSCYEHGGTLPYGPWGEAIESHVVGLERERLTELLDSDPTGPSDVQELSEAVARLLESVGPPLVLVLDDLQWAPPQSLDLLAYVARTAAAPLMIAIYRGRELDISYPLARCLGEVSRHRAGDYLRLEGFSLPDSTALLEDVARAPVAPQTAEALFRASSGNPYFLGELGHHLEASGGVPGIPGWQPPEAIRQAVALRLADLSVPARDVLGRASVLTRGFTFEQLTLLTDLDEGALLLCVEEALGADVIRPVAGECYEFAHAIIRYTLYAGLSPSRRVRLHRRLAQALERLHEGRTSEVAGELARQYHASATLAGAEPGIDHALDAVDQALTARDPLEAIDLALMAIDMTAEDDVATRTRIMTQLALAQAEAGTVADALRSLEATLALLQQSETEPGEIGKLIYDIVSELNVSYPRQSLVRPLVERGLDALGENHDLTWARLKLLGRPQEGGAAGPTWSGFDREAVSIARTQGNEDDYVSSIDWYASFSPAELAAFLPHVEAAREPAVRLRGLVGAAHHLTLMEGPTPVVERLSAELETLARELGSGPAIALAATQRAAILGARGDLAGAATAIAEARTLAETLDEGTQIAAAAMIIDALTAQHVAPDWYRLATTMEGFARSAEPMLWAIACESFAAYAFARADMPVEAERLLAGTIPALAARRPVDYTQSVAVSLAASAVWELRSARLAEDLFPPAHALVQVGVADWYVTSNELTVARLATLLGRSEVALDSFARARAKLSARGQRTLLAIVDYDEAIARRILRHPGAARLLASAKKQFAEVGMEAWTQRIAGQEAATELPDDLTLREAELLRLVSTGLTNNEIASELFLSVHTVERHLTNSYRKIRVRNRADATAHVVRTGL
jgi:DNA-binding CsgD family transcriptional regulator